jgi:hypothetical protein
VTAVYLGAFVVGAIAVLSALLLAEFSIGGGHGADGLPFVSLTSLAAAGTWTDLGDVLSGVIAAVCAVVLLLGLQGLVLPYLKRQQSNSHKGRISYIGLLGTVTLEVPSGGWGEVAFVDADGNRVRSRAVTAEPHALPKSTQVYISDVDADVVHVVSIEGAIPPPPPAPERP